MEAKRLNEILKLSKEEKIELVEELRKNLEQESEDISAEGLETRKIRFERIEKGEEELRDWDEIKKKFIRFDSV